MYPKKQKDFFLSKQKASFVSPSTKEQHSKLLVNLTFFCSTMPKNAENSTIIIIGFSSCYEHENTVPDSAMMSLHAPEVKIYLHQNCSTCCQVLF